MTRALAGDTGSWGQHFALLTYRGEGTPACRQVGGACLQGGSWWVVSSITFLDGASGAFGESWGQAFHLSRALPRGEDRGLCPAVRLTSLL